MKSTRNACAKIFFAGIAASVALTAPAFSQWSLSGNAAGINDFLGTTNSSDLRIRTGNTERMLISGSTGFVRIGPSGNTPEFKLSLYDDGGIMAKGALGTGTTLTTTGSGVRMMWYPKKAAFRVGEVYLDSWDDANIGLNSMAMGWNTKASGSYSTAIGSGTIASGMVSTAMGEVTEATGDASTTMGHRTKATGMASVAMGQYVTANNSTNVVIGNGAGSASHLVNNTANSMMVGFNSTVPTLYVGPSAGAGTTGNVGIKTANPGTALHILDGRLRQETTSDVNHAIELRNSNGGVNRAWSFYQMGNAAGFNASGFSLEYANGAGSWIYPLNVTTTGRVGIGTTAPGTTLDVNGSVRGTSAYQISDARYKREITPLGNALERVMKLNGVSYDWRRNEYPEINFKEGRQIGFLAQEVKEIVPEAVMQDAKGYYSVAYTEFVPLLVEAVKTQQNIIQSQGSRISQLEAALRNMGVSIPEASATGEPSMK